MVKSLEITKRNLIRPAFINKQVLKALFRNKRAGLLEHRQVLCPNMRKDIDKRIKSIYKFDITSLDKMLKKVD